MLLMRILNFTQVNMLRKMSLFARVGHFDGGHTVDVEWHYAALSRDKCHFLPQLTCYSP